MTRSVSLGPLEQEVMNCIWQNEKCTAREVVNYLSQTREIAYNTVQTVMTRLANKGLLKRTLKGKTHVYQAKKKKSTTLRSAIKKSMSSFMDQFGEEALIAFFDGFENISDETRAKLIKKLQANESKS